MAKSKPPGYQYSAKYAASLARAKAQGSTPYAERKAKGIAKGYTPSQAVGKPRTGQLPVTLTPTKVNPRAKGLVTQINRIDSPVLKSYAIDLLKQTERDRKAKRPLKAGKNEPATSLDQLLGVLRNHERLSEKIDELTDEERENRRFFRGRPDLSYDEIEELQDEIADEEGTTRSR